MSKIWELGISSDLLLVILFYYDASAEPYNMISDRIDDDLPPKVKILNTVIP